MIFFKKSVSNPLNPCAILNENHFVYLKSFPKSFLSKYQTFFYETIVFSFSLWLYVF
jgi:hypothetical protein